MTKEENLHWLNKEIETWENECQSKHPIKEALYAARKALEQEPCEDAVSRKTIDQNIYDYAESNGLSYANLKNAILDAPSVTLIQRWIPVTERLPDEGYSVLVMRITDENYKYMRVATYQGDCWMDDTDRFNKPNPHKVIAWMPLPQPYKAESEDK